METIIKITLRSVYGNETAYPDNDQARLICQLTGCRTLRAQDIKTLRAMGFVIEVTHEIVKSSLAAALA